MPSLSDIPHLSAVELSDLIRVGDVSSVEVVTAHLDRIDELNPQINALVSLRDRADVLADAEHADRVIAESSGVNTAQPGPLHGLPVAVKDLEHVAGLPTRSGSLTTSSEPMREDGLVAARLRAAGAIIIGKTNTPEFGTGSHTFNEVFGVTRNPWNPDRSAGGSSGGAAAALAARLVPVADGSDFGGSLRNPAGFCNVVGLRPSIGRVPVPAVNTTHLLRLGVQGPMGRTVADLALVLSALAGPDARDPLSLPEPGDVFGGPLPDPGRVRIGWLGDLGEFRCEPEILDRCRTAVAASPVVTVVDVAPDLTESMFVFRVLRGLSYRGLGDLIPSDKHGLLKATVRENIEYGRTVSVDDVLAAEAARARLHVTMNAAFNEVDVLALPTAQVLPFPVAQEYPTHIDGVEMADYLEWMTACCIITPSGCPAISVPAGFSSDGLPIGVQLVAPVGGEARLLEIAAAVETATGHHLLSPPID